MDNEWIIILILLVSTIVLGIVEFAHIVNEENSACQELGFESYQFVGNMRYCEDIEGNLHYIKLECKDWYWYDCTAKLISVGDVRVK